MFRELAHQGNLQQMSEDAGVNQGHTLIASPPLQLSAMGTAPLVM